MDHRATFTRMDESTQDDWKLIGAEFKSFAGRCPTASWPTSAA